VKSAPKKSSHRVRPSGRRESKTASAEYEPRPTAKKQTPSKTDSAPGISRSCKRTPAETAPKKPRSRASHWSRNVSQHKSKTASAEFESWPAKKPKRSNADSAPAGRGTSEKTVSDDIQSAALTAQVEKAEKSAEAADKSARDARRDAQKAKKVTNKVRRLFGPQSATGAKAVTASKTANDCAREARSASEAAQKAETFSEAAEAATKATDAATAAKQAAATAENARKAVEVCQAKAVQKAAGEVQKAADEAVQTATRAADAARKSTIEAENAREADALSQQDLDKIKNLTSDTKGAELATTRAAAQVKQHLTKSAERGNDTTFFTKAERAATKAQKHAGKAVELSKRIKETLTRFLHITEGNKMWDSELNTRAEERKWLSKAKRWFSKAKDFFLKKKPDTHAPDERREVLEEILQTL